LSFENERRRRINTIMELIEKSGQSGIVPQLLYQKIAPEVTKERLFIYLDELQWAGLICKGSDGKIRSFAKVHVVKRKG